VDGSGNVYVTGRSEGLAGNVDYATVKYDSDGNEEWAARYDGPENNADRASAIAVDGSGNVYVTGWSYSSGTSYDFVTVKYDGSSGAELWAATYAGLGYNRAEYPYDIAVDGSGNVYVAGQTWGMGIDRDYATVKYDSSGTELWARTYNGSGTGVDYAQAIAVDGSGNVYVTGRSTGLTTLSDYATIMYDSGGVQQWVSTYNGPVNGNDYGKVLVLDESGGPGNVDIYVSGQSDGSGTQYDFATIMYDNAGGEQWVSRYDSSDHLGDSPNSIALDSSGSVLVAGWSVGAATEGDYALVKYDGITGGESWRRRYDAVSGDESAHGLAIASSGNIHVTGRSVGDGTNDYDFATVTYDGAGVEQWVARYNGSGDHNDRAVDMAVVSSDAIYVAGRSSGLQNDWATVKYDGAGAEVWVTRHNGVGLSRDYAYAMTHDAAGNVYVTGRAERAGTALDMTTIKYDSSGAEVWVADYNGPAGGNDNGLAITVDASNNVYVAGVAWTGGNPTVHDYATVKYDSNGVQQWAATYNGPGSGNEQPSAIVVDGAGNVYVTGYSLGSGTGYDYATVKYDSAGNEVWVERYNGSGNGTDRAMGMVLDLSGDVVVTGGSVGAGTDSDYVTVKYHSSGGEAWVRTYDGPASGYDRAYSIALDSSSSIYISGTSGVSLSDSDVATIKYDGDGNQLWVRRYDGPDGHQSRGRRLAVDGADNLYVGGHTWGGGGSSDFLLIKYDGSGNELWRALYDGPGNDYDILGGLGLDSSGNAYVTGYVMVDGSFDFATVKYEP
jgi:hypothetical protein